MNVASLLELIAGAQPAALATIVSPTGVSPLPTFQASLLAAQNSSNPFLKIPVADASNTAHLVKSNPEERKSQAAPSEPATALSLIVPQAPLQQQAPAQPQAPWILAAAAQFTDPPSQTLNSPLATNIFSKILPATEGGPLTLSPKIGQPAAVGAQVVVSASEAFVAGPRSADHAYVGSPAPVTDTNTPTSKRKAVAAGADLGIAAVESAVAVASIAAPSLPVPEVAGPAVAVNSSTRDVAPSARATTSRAAITAGFAAAVSAAPTANEVQPATQQSVSSRVPHTATNFSLTPAQQALVTDPHPVAASLEEAANPATLRSSVAAPSFGPQIPHVAPVTQDSAVPPTPPSATPVQDTGQHILQQTQPTPSPVINAVASPVISTDASPLMPLAIQAAVTPLTPLKTEGLSPTAKTSVTAVTNANGPVSPAGGSVPTAKQTVHAVTGPTATQSDSQSTSQQSDQSQGNTAAHAQALTQSQASAIIQPAVVTEHAPPSNTLSPQQPPANPSGSATHSANTINLPTPAATPLHQAPEVNTARLIQSVGQSEMRVGLRSNEFGDISIHTSATRDLVSAQISLDHDELAKTLATHLPDIQAKFGGTQPMEVRIDMNGQAAGQQPGQGQGTAGGAGDGTTGNSQNHQQAKSGGASMAAGIEPRISAGPANAGSLGADRRLDITV